MAYTSRVVHDATFKKEVQKGCHALIDGYRTPYDYLPSLAAGAVFCVLFGLAFMAHTYRTIRYRRLTSVLLGLGALTELIGWIGRTWSAKCPYNNDAFLMQITTLIIAPTFFSAALYMLLGQLIRILGRQSSLISANTYAFVFCACDIVSLIVQAVGGALASIASGKDNGNTKPGTSTMVGGIVFQMATMTLFTVLFIDFMRRVKKMGFPSKYRLVLLAMMVAVAMIFIRSIYRTIELSQGWSGYLITHEVYFIILDAATMVIAVWIFIIFDPAVIISKDAIPATSGSLVGESTSEPDVSHAKSEHGRGSPSNPA